MFKISYNNKITYRKLLLNFLLKYLSPTNPIIIYVSQNLDKLIVDSQKTIYENHIKNTLFRKAYKKAA
ncbi:hypothetical protein CP523_13490 [Clostridium septicum]|uniref:Uncharacterized protein n=1 Tax=Clostridium septicum TaxID=1504 RepID=A0A9N7JMX5_CLOSE|nr:hypothetical protein CP523_13490 [Clostridium septicum]QAS60749.1 hypothetical protein EI377_08390 [Clostridium septicum]